MSETKHTPGPWVANLEGATGNYAGGFSVELWVEGRGLFIVCGRAGCPSVAAESHANARLIAAAPELLAACQALMETHHGYHLGAGQCICHAHEAAKAAIAKAEGR